MMSKVLYPLKWIRVDILSDDRFEFIGSAQIDRQIFELQLSESDIKVIESDSDSLTQESSFQVLTSNFVKM